MLVSHRTGVLIVSLLGIFLYAVNTCGAGEPESGEGGKTYLPGRIGGLEGQELVLELNGSEKLNLTKDGPFSFQTPLVAGANYEVKMIQEPLNHRCEMMNSKGEVSSEPKDVLEIKCRMTGSWSHPTSLQDGLSFKGADTRTAAVAMDDKGSGIVAWSQHDGSNWRIYRAEYRDNKWQKPAGVAEAISPAGGDAKEPRLAIAANGDAVIVWEQKVNKNSHIYLAERRGGEWLIPTSLQDHISPGNTFAWEADVAIDDTGNTIIAWSQEFADSVHVLFKSEYRNGTWHHPASLKEHINPFGGDALRPRVVMNNRGEALITWEQDPKGLSNIYKSEYRKAVWSHPKDLNDHINPKSKSRGAYNAIPVINDSGEAVISWRQTHGMSSRIYKSEYRRGSWQHPRSLSDFVSPPENTNADLNSVAMDNKGNAVLLWTLQEKVNQALYMSEFRNGVWEHPGKQDFLVGSRREFEFRIFGRAALSDSGKGVISWMQRGDDRITQAFFAEYDHGQWYPEKLLNIGSYPAASFGLASSAKGNFIIVWQQSDGQKEQIYSRVFRLIE